MFQMIAHGGQADVQLGGDFVRQTLSQQFEHFVRADNSLAVSRAHRFVETPPPLCGRLLLLMGAALMHVRDGLRIASGVARFRR